MVCVQVKTMSGVTESIQVERECTPSELRKAVCAKLGLDVDQVELVAKVEGKTAVLGDDATPEAMDAVRRGLSVSVVPRVVSGFNMRKDARETRCQSMQGGLALSTPADITSFLSTVQGMAPDGDVTVSVVVQNSDGTSVQSKVQLSDLAGALEQIQTQLQNQPGSSQPKGATAGPAPTGAGPVVEGAENAAVSRQIEQRRVVDKGAAIYREREQKKVEASRIESKLDALRERRAAKAAKRRKREQRRRHQLGDTAELTTQVPTTGYGGLKKGFLMS
eukprot:m.157494 g.157494  ORF g.157494 m.157494 type:complete len:277 (+) comp23666_c0_seq3:650-1480(+)